MVVTISSLIARLERLRNESPLADDALVIMAIDDKILHFKDIDLSSDKRHVILRIDTDVRDVRDEPSTLTE